MRWILALLALLAGTPATADVTIPAAVISDPEPDKLNPASTTAFGIPTGGVEINAVIFRAAGAGAHPTVIVLHGWPGNERNLDISRSAQRAGWNAVTFSYRGSWGSPGEWTFAHCAEDTEAALAYLRRPEVAQRFGIDPERIAVVGHSLGGWLAVRLASVDRNLLGAAAISAPDMGVFGMGAAKDSAFALRVAEGNNRALAGSTPKRAIAELVANGPQWTFAKMLPGLKGQQLLVLSSDDNWKPDAAALTACAKEAGALVESHHAATDHAWSDQRILLQAHVINWLENLLAQPAETSDRGN